ncbi:uncharacterized protein LOC110350369 [Heterocephalus glaber]|uniref:Uncharacterized protein LOC110350369 n=1 Tax=Heterocephalus glaber TaxID=10181 RepID=A0AAX6T9E2_HETGA|nr:uncharacterized protein LOC110350369 [Heterocephalus glaber]
MPLPCVWRNAELLAVERDLVIHPRSVPAVEGGAPAAPEAAFTLPPGPAHTGGGQSAPENKTPALPKLCFLEACLASPAGEFRRLMKQHFLKLKLLHQRPVASFPGRARVTAHWAPGTAPLIHLPGTGSVNGESAVFKPSGKQSHRYEDMERRAPCCCNAALTTDGRAAGSPTSPVPGRGPGEDQFLNPPRTATDLCHSLFYVLSAVTSLIPLAAGKRKPQFLHVKA